MSYEGTYGPDETCVHDRYYRSCAICSNPHAIKAMAEGQTHYDNGAGWCMGCPIFEGRLTVSVKYCPVINTPEQIKVNKIEAAKEIVHAAEKSEFAAMVALRLRKNEKQQAIRILKELENS